MSVTSISSKNKNLLWAVSAGRCEYIGCNKVLHTDPYAKPCYILYIHIFPQIPPKEDFYSLKKYLLHSFCIYFYLYILLKDNILASEAFL